MTYDLLSMVILTCSVVHYPISDAVTTMALTMIRSNLPMMDFCEERARFTALHGHLVYGPSRKVVRCESVAIGHLADKAEAYRRGGRAVEGLISRT